MFSEFSVCVCLFVIFYLHNAFSLVVHWYLPRSVWYALKKYGLVIFTARCATYASVYFCVKTTLCFVFVSYMCLLCCTVWCRCIHGAQIDKDMAFDPTTFFSGMEKPDEDTSLPMMAWLPECDSDMMDTPKGMWQWLFVPACFKEFVVFLKQMVQITMIVCLLVGWINLCMNFFLQNRWGSRAPFLTFFQRFTWPSIWFLTCVRVCLFTLYIYIVYMFVYIIYMFVSCARVCFNIFSCFWTFP